MVLKPKTNGCCSSGNAKPLCLWFILNHGQNLSNALLHKLVHTILSEPLLRKSIIWSGRCSIFSVSCWLLLWNFLNYVVALVIPAALIVYKLVFSCHLVNAIILPVYEMIGKSLLNIAEYYLSRVQWGFAQGCRHNDNQGSTIENLF